MWTGGLRFLGAICCGLYAMAAAQPAPQSTADSASPAAQPATPDTTGDVVQFKGGGTLRGIQVLRADSAVVEILTTSGPPPLSLARSQVISIDYDDVNPGDKTNSLSATQTSPIPTVVTGTKLSREFDQKLFAPLPEESLRIRDADFVVFLTDLATRLSIPLDVEAAVRSLPTEQRRWSAEIDPGASFITLLEDLTKAFPQIQTTFHPDRVALALRSVDSGTAAP